MAAYRPKNTGEGERSSFSPRNVDAYPRGNRGLGPDQACQSAGARSEDDGEGETSLAQAAVVDTGVTVSTRNDALDFLKPAGGGLEYPVAARASLSPWSSDSVRDRYDDNTFVKWPRGESSGSKNTPRLQPRVGCVGHLTVSWTHAGSHCLLVCHFYGCLDRNERLARQRFFVVLILLGFG